MHGDDARRSRLAAVTTAHMSILRAVIIVHILKPRAVIQHRRYGD